MYAKVLLQDRLTRKRNNTMIHLAKIVIERTLQQEIQLTELGAVIERNLVSLEKGQDSTTILARLTLLWLTIAEAPLSVRDLSNGLPYICEDLSIRSMKLVPDADMRNVFDRLTGLATVDWGNHLTHLASNSVKEKIVEIWSMPSRKNSISLSDVLERMAVHCVWYLRKSEFQHLDLKSESGMIDVWKRYPFLSHAALCWGMYCRKSLIAVTSSPPPKNDYTQTPDTLGELSGVSNETTGHDDSTAAAEVGTHTTGFEASTANNMQDHATPIQIASQPEAPTYPLVVAQALDLLETRSSLSLAMLLAMYLSKDPLASSSTWPELNSWVKSMSELHIASRLGLVDLVRIKLDRDPSGHSNKDERGRTPLHEAVRGGFEDVVVVLQK